MLMAFRKLLFLFILSCGTVPDSSENGISAYANLYVRRKSIFTLLEKDTLYPPPALAMKQLLSPSALSP